MIHKPVLQKEVIQHLDPKPNENFIDATLGQAGHAKSILMKNAPQGKVLGIERDIVLYQQIGELPRLIAVNDSYVNIKEIVKRHNFKPLKGILADLGLSSWHLDESDRGFSFHRDEPLDMRYKAEGNNLTAAEIVNKWPGKKIEEILKAYGQEKFGGEIAEKIIKEREKEAIKSTFQLVTLIKKAVPEGYRKKGHPARKTFQALRIAVNDELRNLGIFLPKALEILEKEGKLLIISFHSLEDKITKNFFKENQKKGLLKIINKKPIIPSSEEVGINPRSRSAKLRIIEKI